MTIKKPKLSLDEQIEHLKDKGILFNIMDESDAKKYLEQNNNYPRLFTDQPRKWLKAT